MRPESPAVTRPAPPAAGAGEAASFLLARDTDPRRESRRIAAGFFALAILVVLLVNLGIFQAAQSNLSGQGWQQLVENTDNKCKEVRELLTHFAREARLVTGQPELQRAAVRALQHELPADERLQLDAELDGAARTLGLRSIEIVDPADGAVLARSSRGSVPGPVRHLDLIRRALRTGQPVTIDIHQESNGDQLLAVVVPLPASAQSGRAPIAVFHASIADEIGPLLSRWPGSGATGGAYLVRRDGAHVVFLTGSPNDADLRAGRRLPMSRRDVLAAAMAAAGMESSVEVTDSEGRRQWAVTRFLSEFNWGVVGLADRSAMLAGLRGTLVMLLMLDLVLAAGGAVTLWFWRRRYASGLARREMEVTKRHAERVQAIFDTAFDAIATFDRHGRLRSVNRAAETLLGRSAAEMDSQPIHRFLHWENEEASGEPALPEPGTVCRGEALRADGEIVPVEFSLGKTGQDDDLLCTAIVRDISERVEAERRIREFAEGLELSNRRLEEVNAQLEEASRLKSEFLANTSHELRTPLNGMIGFLQLVLDGMCQTREEEQDFLKQALQCSRHLLGLINDVLDIAKIEAGKLNLEIGKVDAGTLFDEVYTVTHVQAAQKGVALRFEAPEGDEVPARGDFGKIKQVLINLVGNALKFTSKGSITVRATPHVDLGHIMFEVVDTGIGIAADRQLLIFEKFTQGDGSTTRKYGGTGLGLAISRSLIELMGGIIGVHSEGEGTGTRMYFSLPLWREEAEETAAAPEHAGDRIEGPAGGPLVLIVEDDPTFRIFLCAVLHRSGYRTAEAAHAEAGWMLARRLRPAVVVIDYALTCAETANLRTGWDLAERMAGDPKTRHIPIIFVTGFENALGDKLKRTAFARRPEHMVKPIDGNALIAKIEELVGADAGRLVRILMADDDPSVTAFVRKVLPEGRFHIEVANNGEECLHVLRTQPRGFDLLLLDLMMPEVSGYDVLREMTLSGMHTDLPVLVLTNYPEARNEEERRLLERGLVLDVLPKTSVHDNPQLLPHVIDWHLQVAAEQLGSAPSAEAEREAA